MRTALFSSVLVLAWTVPGVARDPTASEPYQPLTIGQKASIFARRAVEPSAVGKSIFTSGLSQWNNSPPEWGQGMEGYGKRLGNKLATRGMEQSVGFAAASLLRQDPRYFRSGKEGVWIRTRHALTHTARTRKDNGEWTFPLWRLSANYGAQFISNSWRPPSQNSAGNAAVRGTVSIGYDALSNLFKEFWPDIKQRVFKRRKTSATP